MPRPNHTTTPVDEELNFAPLRVTDAEGNVGQLQRSFEEEKRLTREEKRRAREEKKRKRKERMAVDAAAREETMKESAALVEGAKQMSEYIQGLHDDLDALYPDLTGRIDANKAESEEEAARLRTEMREQKRHAKKLEQWSAEEQAAKDDAAEERRQFEEEKAARKADFEKKALAMEADFNKKALAMDADFEKKALAKKTKSDELFRVWGLEAQRYALLSARLAANATWGVCDWNPEAKHDPRNAKS